MSHRRAEASSNQAKVQAKVIVVTADAVFEDSIRATFGTSTQVGLDLVPARLADCASVLDLTGAAVIIADVEAADVTELEALEALVSRANHGPPIIAITESFDAGVARRLMQMRVADFLVKPVPPIELVRTCARVAKSASERNHNGSAAPDAAEAQIFTFLPAVGGAGVTTLAVQTAMLLLSSGTRGKTATCLVDLDFQHGACADYLDIEPRLNLNEIEPRPERLDRQLLEVMISQHPSGLAVVAAPNRPAEMRSFDPDVVTRLLDLVSSHFDYVVFDMPRTWFSWTDSVLLGSNKVFIVSEATVPGLRQAKQLVGAIRERLGGDTEPKVIINRFVQKMMSASLRRSDVEAAIGDAFLACLPNDYGLVREAIDRGVPLDEIKKGNRISLELRKLVLPQVSAKPAEASSVKRLALSWARS
ncbi:MAG TPA: AAA family ATPase [Xanthobacteraceae bacterium]|jgi:pilus assembly protein CpaE|nr:AAA family ATPase [Xanthobacteraceae bacterium]